MMELVDITDLKSVASWCPGSSPGESTNMNVVWRSALSSVGLEQRPSKP